MKRECDLFLTSLAFGGVVLKINVIPQVLSDHPDLVKEEFCGENSNNCCVRVGGGTKDHAHTCSYLFVSRQPGDIVKDLISIGWHHRQAQDVHKQTFPAPARAK